ncbi:MAG: NADH-quinone oxidoreductase subunit N [bacterium]
MPLSNTELLQLFPFYIVGFGIIFSLILEMFFSKSKVILPYITALIFISVAIYSIFNVQNHAIIFGGMLELGGKTAVFNIIFGLGAFVVTLSSINYIKKYGSFYGEYYILIQLAVLGMMIMAGSKDLFMVFMGLELMSISFYVLVGINRKRIGANEAAMKYFLLGAFATGFIVYGIALIYGAAQTTSIDFITVNFSILSTNVLFVVGLVLFIIGFSFKIAAFPFHSWVPDVYQGSSTTITGLMSTTGKTAAFSVLIIILYAIFAGSLPNILRPYFSAIAAFSMLFGSIVAISQKNIKRMLAYSSISHAGYISIGLAAGNSEALAGMIFYLFAYTFMNLGAFGIISIIESENENDLELSSYMGLGNKSPMLAGLLSVFMFALAGLPPLAGFFGKYYVFISAVKADLIWLALVGILASVISVYFYLRIVVYMYFKESVTDLKIKYNFPEIAAVVISAVIILFYGLLPQSLLTFIYYSLKF